jgi:hypothetical protein
MASEDTLNKPAADGRKSDRNEDLKQSQAPQVQPPFLSDGPELMRDSHC